ncbi:hypothetical protein HanRHA438_Chr11g0503091 [Helianthus annuus]|nr:hypothetical protein HanRHA438_Chr11g0503091 [Helianthus annuus]
MNRVVIRSDCHSIRCTLNFLNKPSPLNRIVIRSGRSTKVKPLVKCNESGGVLLNRITARSGDDPIGEHQFQQQQQLTYSRYSNHKILDFSQITSN